MILGVIPARFASTRFPGKPLQKIAGKPLIQWVVEASLKSKSLSAVIVATDHEEIFSLAKKLGAEAVMTDSDLPSGTDRVYAAVKNKNFDWVLNIQGDEPLLKSATIDQFCATLQKTSSDVSMGTLGHALQEADLQNPNIVKVLLNQKSEAIYFSRFPIPFSREKFSAAAAEDPSFVLKHIGIYAFRKLFLEKFCLSPVSRLEKAESLEQLRALDLGARIQVLQIQDFLHGVDSPQDIAIVERHLETAQQREGNHGKN